MQYTHGVILKTLQKKMLRDLKQRKGKSDAFNVFCSSEILVWFCVCSKLCEKTGAIISCVKVSRHLILRNIHRKQKLYPRFEILIYFWWLKKSRFSGCFEPKVWEGGGYLRMTFGLPVSAVWVVSTLIGGGVTLTLTAVIEFVWTFLH